MATVQGKLTASILRHNPGNVSKLPDGQKWLGEVESDSPRFSAFDTPLHGLRALAKTLIAYETKHEIKTLSGAVHRYAPPEENQTKEYVRNVSTWTGIPANAPISLKDNLEKLLPAFVRQENGQQPYSATLIGEACVMARRA